MYLLSFLKQNRYTNIHYVSIYYTLMSGFCVLCPSSIVFPPCYILSNTQRGQTLRIQWKHNNFSSTFDFESNILYVYTIIIDKSAYMLFKAKNQAHINLNLELLGNQKKALYFEYTFFFTVQGMISYCFGAKNPLAF